VVSNVSRLYLVWRFVHIQPFNRNYLRLALPASACAVAMVVAHLAASGGSWPVDLVATALAGTVVYVAVLLGAGLTPTEKATVARVWRRDGGT
jgi:hypothetical protein